CCPAYRHIWLSDTRALFVTPLTRKVQKTEGGTVLAGAPFRPGAAVRGQRPQAVTDRGAGRAPSLTARTGRRAASSAARSAAGTRSRPAARSAASTGWTTAARSGPEPASRPAAGSAAGTAATPAGG